MKRNILITGATKGIGLATAIRLAKEGHHVIGIARNKVDFPGTLYLTDLMDLQATEQTFQSIHQKHTVDGIVNNAGFALRSRFQDIQVEDYDQVMQINLKPALQGMKIFSASMIEKKFGRIVNIASRAILGVGNASSYAAAKAALIAFTKCWVLELARTGVTVNAIAPGVTTTERFRKARPIGSEVERLSLASIPMNRFARPEEIAAAICFFLSDDASFITGQTLFVDGGGSIGNSLVY
jgi:NAD(P)-dependent dehydrogenase (short-subunit alcohol dehydrogenase family)